MKDYPCLYRNISGRPLELHGGAAVRILAPDEIIVAEAPDAELLALERKGALSRHAPPSPPPAPPPSPSASTRKTKAAPRHAARATTHKGDKA
ncbi:hypothetical protein ACUSIJ_16315 [Pseudochelatococcus sp. B33]